MEFNDPEMRFQHWDIGLLRNLSTKISFYELLIKISAPLIPNGTHYVKSYRYYEKNSNINEKMINILTATKSITMGIGLIYNGDRN